jgi:hypothetical protein
MKAGNDHKVSRSDGVAAGSPDDAHGPTCHQPAELVGPDRRHERRGLEFLRRLGDPRFEPLTNFLAHAKPETLTFLTEARPEEVANLQEGIRLVVAIQLLGESASGASSLYSAPIVGAILNWDKLAAWRKGP